MKREQREQRDKRILESNCFLASKLANFAFAPHLVFRLADLLPEQIARLLVMLQRVLDGLDLHGDGRQHRLLQAVELVEAAPGAALDQAHEDPAHRLHVDALESNVFPERKLNPFQKIKSTSHSEAKRAAPRRS